MVKVLYPVSRAEEYEYRAKYLKDEYHMSGDGPRSTEFRINKILGLVPFERTDKVLDISPGKGLLFERIHEKVSECWGIDVTPAMVQRLEQKFKGLPNISFEMGPSSKLPYPDFYFDKVLMTGAFCLQETKEECIQTLAEIRRVAKNDATIFISDIPVADESTLVPEHLSPITRLRRRIQQDGLWEFFMSVKRYIFWKIRVLLEREPVLVESTKGIWFPESEFREMCRKNRLEPKGFPTEMITGTSSSRYDYLLRPLLPAFAYWQSLFMHAFENNLESYL